MPIVDYKGRMDLLLSGVSMDFAQDQQDYIADKVFPTIPVERESGSYITFPRGWFTRDHVAERPLGDEPYEATYGLSSATYSVKEYALAMSLDDRERANIAPNTFNPDETHVRFLTDNHLIHRERIWADRFFRTGVWGTDLTGTTVAATDRNVNIQQWDQANSNPQVDINFLKARMALKTGREANAMIIGRDVWTALQTHPTIIERVKYTSAANTTLDSLKAYLELDDIFVPKTVQNVAPELAPQLGDNADLRYIVNPKGMLLLYRNPMVGMRMATGGLTFVWRGLLGGGGFTMPVYRDRKTRAFSDWFAVRTAYDMKVVAPECGVYVNAMVA